MTCPFDQINPPNQQSCGYTHDDLQRAASVNCGPVWSQTFSYDALGNINKSGTSSFQPTYSTATNRMTSLPGFTPTYDANGNLLNDSLHIYAWDAEGRPVTVDSVGLTYDALGRMVEQNRSGVYSQIVYTPTGNKLAIMSGQSLQKAFVPLIAGASAVYSSAGLSYYRHPDWLGSSRLASTPSRTVYYDGAYAPFGESYVEMGTTSRSFTGQNQDTVTGLYDFMFREYSAVQGRWVSPDPLGLGAASAGEPQSWNRYAYVGNTPLVGVDALGLLRSDVPYAYRFGHAGGFPGMDEFDLAAMGLLLLDGPAGFCPAQFTHCQQTNNGLTVGFNSFGATRFDFGNFNWPSFEGQDPRQDVTGLVGNPNAWKDALLALFQNPDCAALLGPAWSNNATGLLKNFSVQDISKPGLQPSIEQMPQWNILKQNPTYYAATQSYGVGWVLVNASFNALGFSQQLTVLVHETRHLAQGELGEPSPGSRGAGAWYRREYGRIAKACKTNRPR